jgi:adenylosuccinate lyase
VIVPDSCILLDYMLSLMTDVLDRLIVYPENMRKNLDITHGLIFSQSVLLALTNRGMKREDAYSIVQSCAMESWRSGKSFLDLLKADPRVTEVLHSGELDDLFDVKRATKHVEYIFQRAGL